MHDLQFGVSLNDLISDDVDPSKVTRTIKQVHHATFLSSPHFDTPSMEAIMPLAINRMWRIPTRPRATVAALSHLYEVGNPLLLSNKYETITFEDFCAGQAKLDLASYSNHVQEPPIVLDTGASTSLTPVLSDFVGELTKPESVDIQGLSSSTKVVGVGTVEWAG